MMECLLKLDVTRTPPRVVGQIGSSHCTPTRKRGPAGLPRLRVGLRSVLCLARGFPKCTTTPRRAFTLVELVIVVLITSILAVVAAPKYAASVDRFRAEAGAKRIAADMNVTRERAMMRSSYDGINFFAATDRYQMINDPGIDRSTREYWVDFSRTPYPVDLVSATFINTGGATNMVSVEWDMNGRAFAYVFPRDSTKPLASGQVVVQAGTEQRMVVIDPVTGEASVQ